MLPSVGFSCSRISLAVVVLPQPDSPISPSVSPGMMAKSTVSTAFTQPVRRCSSPPVLTGKYFFSPCTSSTGAVICLLGGLRRGAPAACRPALVEACLRRFLHRALRHRVGAARMECAARRQPCEIRRLAGDRIQRLLAAELRDRAKQ